MTHDPRIDPLLAHPWTLALRAARESQQVHLVGGAIRDACLRSSRPADLDITVDRRATELARRLADHVHARLVVLGRKEHAALRLIPADSSFGELDIWDREGGTLRADLERRDFTIHALAVDIVTGQIVDPFSGLDDLERRVLRDTTAQTLFADPQRTVRLVRLAAQLFDFSIEPGTRRRAEEASNLLDRVASERIAVELSRWTRQVRFDLAADVMAGLPPFAGIHPALDDLTRLRRLFDLHPEAQPEKRAEAVWSTIHRRAPAAFRGWLDRGWVAPEVARAVGRHRAAGAIPADEPERREWIARLGRDWSTAARAELAASEPAMASEVLATLTASAGDASLFTVRGLITGEDLRNVGVPPGPTLGALLADLRRLEIRGELSDREEALRLAGERWRRTTSATSGAD